MRLDQILDTRRFRNPDKIAIVDGERRRTFGQIERDAEAFAGTLRALGVRRGDRVAVFMENSVEAVVAIFISGRDAATLPKKMYESIRLESDPIIAVVSSLLISAVLFGVLLSVVLRRKPANVP